jgi:hypothetical protein
LDPREFLKNLESRMEIIEKVQYKDQLKVNELYFYGFNNSIFQRNYF